jgi:hypothetical protein
MKYKTPVIALLIFVFGCGKPTDPQADFVKNFHSALISKNEVKLQKLYVTSKQLLTLIESASETDEWKNRNREKIKVFDEYKTRFCADIKSEIYTPLFGVVWDNVKINDYKFIEKDSKKHSFDLLCAATDGKKDFKIRIKLTFINGIFYVMHRSTATSAVNLED